jgi:hypothetical protein
MTKCAYPECPVPAIGQCDNCDSNYCFDHGTPGGDRPVQDVGMVAYPARCWKCGGFNADAGIDLVCERNIARVILGAA